MQLSYVLARAYREQRFIETGETVAPTHSVVLAADALTPALRAHLLRRRGTVDAPNLLASCELATYAVGHGHESYPIRLEARLELAAPATDADALRLLAEDAARYDAALAVRLARIDADIATRITEVAQRVAALAAVDPATATQHQLPKIVTRLGQQPDRVVMELPTALGDRPRTAELAAAIDAYNAQAVAAWDAYRAAEARREQDRLAAKAQRLAERETWVAAHGSPFLRQACGAGYDCQRRYVTERAALERPGFAVDFDDRAEWKARSCPSEAALDVALTSGGTVVWLTRPVAEDEASYWQPCEAVVEVDYLDAYTLVKEF